jgi:4a-hydroxytetrahydrobiopterin dehydratase
MNELSNEKIVPIKGDSPRLEQQEIQQSLGKLPNWKLFERNGEKQLERTFSFPDFATALGFTMEVGRQAEAENHHPALLTEWGKVTVTWWTHKIHGLHMNDFIMASRTEDAYEQQRAQTERTKPGK